MPFVFPKRVLRDGDLLKKEDFNADWQPVAEMASGGIDAHNLDSSSLGSNVVVADSALHKAYYVEEGVNSGWGDPTTGYTRPTLATLPTDAWVVPITSNWSAVDGMQITSVITGTSNLWVVGWVAYVYYGFSNVDNARGSHSATAASVVEDAGLQIAIRVDGQIVMESVTGHADDRFRPFEALKPTRHRDAADPTAELVNAPGPGLKESHVIRGHGPQAGAIRVITNVPVGPGNHTVEIVARVIQKDNPRGSSVTGDNAVGIHNRKLFVLDCPIVPVAAPSRSAIEIAALDDASVASTASFKTARSDVLVAGLNSIDAGNLARGSFTNRHLPDTPLDVSYTWIRPTGPVEYDCKYPGHDTDTIVARTTNLTGWAWVQDSTGPKYLRSDADTVRGAVDFVTTTAAKEDCLFVVLADVQLHEIDGAAGERAVAGEDPAITDFAAFAIAYKDNGGGTNVLGTTEAYFNNHLFWPMVANNEASLPIEISVPLFHVFNFSPQTLPTAGAAHGSDIDYIGVVASTFSTCVRGGGGAAAIVTVPDMFCQRGALTVLQLRG